MDIYTGHFDLSEGQRLSLDIEKQRLGIVTDGELIARAVNAYIQASKIEPSSRTGKSAQMHFLLDGIERSAKQGSYKTQIIKNIALSPQDISGAELMRFLDENVSNELSITNYAEDDESVTVYYRRVETGR